MMYRGATWVLILGLSFILGAFSPCAYAKDTTPKKAAVAEQGQSKNKSATAEKDAKKQKVAVVNGTIITQAEFNSEMSRYERQMAITGKTPDAEQQKELKKMVLQGLIDRELLKQECQKLGVKVEDAEVNEQIETLKKRFSNEADFKTTLTKMNVTEAELRAQFAQDMAIKKMIDQQITSKVNISADDAKAFYDSHPELFKTPEMVRASHILIKVDPQASAEDKAKAREKIVELQKKVQKGEDFAAVAKASSECPSSAKGGDLDFFQKGQMVAPFEESAFALKKGAVSDIVETQFGYHLIKQTDKKDPGVTPYAEIKDKIDQHLKQEKVNQQLTQHIDQLKSTAKIETFTN